MDPYCTYQQDQTKIHLKEFKIITNVKLKTIISINFKINNKVKVLFLLNRKQNLSPKSTEIIFKVS